jgi:outer membrane protein assembly complex protein YaeT
MRCGWREVTGVAAALASFLPAPALSQDDVEQPVVRSLRFKGNTAIDDRTLRVSLATSQAGFFYRFPLTRMLGLGDAPRFDLDDFRRDVLRIEAMYGVRGFPQALVDTTIERDGLDYSIVVSITEGTPMVVDTIVITGAEPHLDRDDIDRALPLRQGDPFDRINFQGAADRLALMLGNEGFAFARVGGGYVVAADGRSVRVELEAHPGPRAVIERIVVEGADRIDQRVILKAMSLQPGDVYSNTLLEQSELDLFETDLFRQASVRVEDSLPEHPGDSSVTVKVIARVSESPLRRARVSAGYGTLSCFRTMGALDLYNFTGGGRRLELRASTAMLGVGPPLDAGFEHGPCPFLAREDTSRLKLNYNLSLTLHDPLLITRHGTGTLGVFAERHTEVGAFLRETVGGQAAVTRNLADKMPLRLAYELSYGRTVADPATFCTYLNVCRLSDISVFQGRRLQSTVGVRLVRDHTNSAMDPSEGTAVTGEFRFAAGWLGADTLTRFARMSAEFESHHPVGLDGVLSWRIEAGTVFSPVVGLSAGAASFTPPEERFYAGGATSVRGFGQSLMGPVVRVLDTVRVNDSGVPDSTIRTSPTGGTAMMLGSVEFRYPLPLLRGKLTGAVFVDVGQVVERRAVRLDAMRVTPGIGIRYASLLGPIRLDLAFNPHSPQDSPLYRAAGGSLELVLPVYRPSLSFLERLQFHFSIGQPF